MVAESDTVLFKAIHATLQPVMPAVARAFYGYLLTLEPELTAVCPGADHEQRWFAATLDELIGAVEHWDLVLRYARSLGTGLAQRGVQQRHYTGIGVALLAALHDQFGVAFTLEQQIAWARAYAALAEVMSDAAVSRDGSTKIPPH